MRYLLDSKLMKEADQFTIEQKGVSAMVLMEQAAKQCVRYLKELKEKAVVHFSNICIVCGTGNNGGDGFAIARLLIKEGVPVTAVLVGERSKCTKETSDQIEMLEQCGSNVQVTFPEQKIDIIVDALFGVGLNRNVAGAYAKAIKWMNDAAGFKLAVDIPSGISADTGCIMGTAFRADATVTIQEQKLGMECYPGKEYAGVVLIRNIGIESRKQKKSLRAVVIPEASEYTALLPVRKEDSNKGTYGKLLLIAGSKGMAGAAYLSAKAAYHTGTGLVTIYTPEENRLILQTLLPDAIITTYDTFDKGEIIRLLRWADVVTIGPGIGMSERSKKLLVTVLECAEIPCVVDADGLNLLAENPKYRRYLSQGAFVLTPHIKEMSRLTNIEIAQLKQERFTILKDYVNAYIVTCVLKDSRTLIASPNAQVCMNTTGNCAMAKAGAGDVLSGIIAGLLAQGVSCREAGILGTYLHGAAGDKARAEKGSYSVMAEDLITYLSDVMREEEKKRYENLE